MSDLSVQQQQQLNLYLKKNPKVSREKAINLLFGGRANQSVGKGVTLEHSTQRAQLQTIYLQSGRKIIYTKLKDGHMACKYYGADGTQLKPEYFKKVEGQISISPDGASYTVTKNGKTSKPIKAKNPVLGQIDQNIVKLNNQEKELNKVKEEQGFIGNGWDWFKNKTGIGDGSDKAQNQINAERDMLKQLRKPNTKIDSKQFEKITGQKYTKANVEKFKKGELSQASQKVTGYQEGQEMAVDVTADVISGVASFTTYTVAVAAAPFTGGASIALGVAVAAGTGALIKSGVKAADAFSGGRKYTFDDFKKDAGTGAVSGMLAPVTSGIGGAVGKTVATKLGLQTVKTVGKEIAEDVVENSFKQTLKTSLMSPGAFKFVGEGVGKKTLAYGSEVLADGVINGGIDNGFRTAVNGGSLSDVVRASGEGALFAPLVGLGMKGSGYILSRSIGKNFVVHGKNVIENKRMLLKQKMAQGNKISLGGDGISIPKGKLKAPSSKFAETDEAFTAMINKNKYKILQMQAEYRVTGNKKGYLSDLYKFICKEMDIENVSLKLVNDEDIRYGGAFIPASKTVELNMNYNGDSVEVITHELNHYLQFKEQLITGNGVDVVANNDAVHLLKEAIRTGEIKTQTEANQFYNSLYKIGKEGYSNDYSDVLNGTKYPKNTNPNDYYFKKANQYNQADIDYVDGSVDYERYEKNLKEVESKRRGILSAKLINESPEKQVINSILENIPNADAPTKLALVDLAIEEMQKDIYRNYTADQFVVEFFRKYVSFN